MDRSTNKKQNLCLEGPRLGSPVNYPITGVLGRVWFLEETVRTLDGWRVSRRIQRGDYGGTDHLRGRFKVWGRSLDS